MKRAWVRHNPPTGRSAQRRAASRIGSSLRFTVVLWGLLICGVVAPCPLHAAAQSASAPGVPPPGTNSLTDQTRQVGPTASAPVPNALWTGGAGLAGLFVLLRLKRRWFA